MVEAVDSPDNAGDGQDVVQTGTGETGWKPLPEGVVVADNIDLDSPDPAWVEGRQRQCIAERQKGGRCTAPACNDAWLCSAHDRRLDPRLANATRRARSLTRQQQAEQADALRRLGTRAVVAQVLAEEATKVAATVRHLVTRSGNGDLDAARALIPWLNQGLGMPTERVEHQAPTSAADVASLDTASLAELVARGRAQRLRAVDSQAQ